MHWFDTIDSTNTRLKEMARQGAPHGTVVIAGQQTGGRGRMGRSFSSAGGGVYLSVLLRPKASARELMHLTCAAAVAMCEAVEAAAGLRPRVKWINDLVAGKRKLGGILTELGFGAGGSIEYAVVGIGINCCQKSGDFPGELQSIATSLAMEGAPCLTEKLAAEMVLALERMDRRLLAEQDAIMEVYRSRCVTLGAQVQVIGSGAVRQGKALDIDREGALLVEYADASREWVASGEVSVRGMYGYL